MTPTIIKPTVGRRVWFRPSAAFLANNPALTQFNPEQPMDAGIVYVHHDHMVNLIVTDHVGMTFQAPCVPLLAGQYEPAEDGDVYCCCEWMPYQKGQAANADAAAKAPADTRPTQREQLELALVSGLAVSIGHSPDRAGEFAAGVLAVLDKLHPLPVPVGQHSVVAPVQRSAHAMAREAAARISATHHAVVASIPDAAHEVSRDEVKVRLMLDKQLPAHDGKPMMADSSAADPEKFGVVAIDAIPVVDPGPDSLEREIQAKANKAPRVTPADIEAEIQAEVYFSAIDGHHGYPDCTFNRMPLNDVDRHIAVTRTLGLLTFCVLVLRNGLTVTGESTCASSGIIDEEEAHKIARQKAVKKALPLLGFRMRDELAAD